jgi:hypothetical protein
MNNSIVQWIAIAVIGVIAFVGLVGGNSQPVPEPVKLGGGTSDSWSVGGALSVTGDGTVSGGTLNVTTANTATSTIIGGCYQFYATSTATAQKFQATTTPGLMFSTYGTCPNL